MAVMKMWVKKNAGLCTFPSALLFELSIHCSEILFSDVKSGGTERLTAKSGRDMSPMSPLIPMK